MPVTREIQGLSGSVRQVSPQAYPAEKARQGEIVLKTKLSRIVFLAGLFGGLFLMAAVVVYLAFAP
ncbi:MAG: hypothetical protein R3D30_06535 [Hyphomicrobiales bacterium]